MVPPLTGADPGKLHLLPSLPLWLIALSQQGTGLQPSDSLCAVRDFAKHLLESLINVQWGVIKAGQKPKVHYLPEAAEATARLSFEFWPQMVGPNALEGGSETVSAYHKGGCRMDSVTGRGRKGKPQPAALLMSSESVKQQ